MKKQNTWMTIALGGLVTVTVAAVAIVWSGTRTKENPGIGLESTNRPDVGNEVLQEIYVGDTEVVESMEEVVEETTEENPLHGRWEVAEYDDVSAPESVQAMENDVRTPDEQEDVAQAGGTPVYSLNFASDERVSWPVQGNVIQYYSMDTTVYFPTLEQYKCSPAIEIQSEVGTAVNAPANAKVAEVGEDARIGKYVRMELGNDYQIILGQLGDICVSEGDYVARGAQIGTVAAPTRYFVVEGDNVYFQMLCGEQTIDPLDYLE